MKNEVIEIKEETRIGDIILEKGDKIKVLENRKVTPERRRSASDFIKRSPKKVSYIDEQEIIFEDGNKFTWERINDSEFRMNNKWVKPYVRAATNAFISIYGEMPPGV